VLTIYNSIGTPIETKTMDFVPKYCAMSKTDIIVASTDAIFHWTFKSTNAAKLNVSDFKKEKLFHIDDADIIGSKIRNNDIETIKRHEHTKDSVSCVAINDLTLIIGRISGIIYQYILPSFELSNKYSLPISPTKILINCNSTRISIMDPIGNFKIFALKSSSKIGEQIEVIINLYV
jgi:WD repeat-containing protein 35